MPDENLIKPTSGLMTQIYFCKNAFFIIFSAYLTHIIIKAELKLIWCSDGYSTPILLTIFEEESKLEPVCAKQDGGDWFWWNGFFVLIYSNQILTFVTPSILELWHKMKINVSFSAVCDLCPSTMKLTSCWFCRRLSPWIRDILDMDQEPAANDVTLNTNRKLNGLEFKEVNIKSF